jgi:hypothetical protein
MAGEGAGSLTPKSKWSQGSSASLVEAPSGDEQATGQMAEREENHPPAANRDFSRGLLDE